MKPIVLASAACLALALAACTPDPDQRHLQSRSLDSGVTSSNGGGQFQTHNQPNIGVSNGGASTDVSGVRGRLSSPQ